MRHARIALTCGFLLSIVLAGVTEDSGTVSAHRYNEYWRYEGGPVTNLFAHATHCTRPVRAISRAKSRTLRGSPALEHQARSNCGLDRRKPGELEHLRRLSGLPPATGRTAEDGAKGRPVTSRGGTHRAFAARRACRTCR